MSGWQAGDGTPEGVLTEERPGSTHPDGLVDERRRRRRAAEATADAAEAAAADAAARASAAIAAAAAAAAAAEAAADLAARAAADAEDAAADERQAVERAHAINSVSANETTTVALAPVPALNGSAAPNGFRPSRQQVAVPGQALPPDEAAVARAATMTISAVPLREIPASGGRAARRRAQEAAAAAAAVSREANRDPDTHVFTVEPEAVVEAPAAPRRRARTEDGSPLTSLLARFRGLPGSRMVMVAAAVGGVILVAALVAGLVGGSRGASNAAVVQDAPASAAAAAPTSAAGDPDAAVDPTSTKAVAYLEALRAADVPTSSSGQSETEAAEVICQQLAKGAEAADLVRALPAVLPTVNTRQAKSVVSIAQKSYCS